MADAYHHAVSSARQYGGVPDDYLAIHQWLDRSKGWLAAPQHRAISHHAEGIVEAIERFGQTIAISTCGICGEKEIHENHDSGRRHLPDRHRFQAKRVSVRWIGEQHVLEDFGRIPTAADFLRKITLDEPWMYRGARKLSRELDPRRTEKEVPAGEKIEPPLRVIEGGDGK